MSTREVVLRWTGEGDAFTGGVEGGVQISIDGGRVSGPSPMDALLLAVAGCMGVDVLMILQKGRVPLTAMDVVVSGDRAEDPPRRFTSLRLTYRLTGPEAEHEDRIERAITLSRDKYCSVLHTLRDDLDLTIDYTRA